MGCHLDETHGAQGTNGQRSPVPHDPVPSDHVVLLRVFLIRSVQISIIINHGSRRAVKTCSHDIN